MLGYKPLLRDSKRAAAGLAELNVGGPVAAAPQAQPKAAAPSADPFADPFDMLGGGGAAPKAAAAPTPQLPVLLSAEKAKGLTLRGQLERQNGQIGKLSILC